ncbi:hypothetical protein F5B22DRAFT_591841 [Xylaria bambusicola]|uniref:uncharacterized protein n=1 Tax=Xylaria bambusicola TaxID=326684 RepID=UPI002007B01C|nr:uncharacterized protein F5B22DRAFT_591841 [Xylaria bambusicola]KAI0523752.1 hypothetical protein F5B22DRAFT_591841 [Xylaria bambusicola]
MRAIFLFRARARFVSFLLVGAGCLTHFLHRVLGVAVEYRNGVAASTHLDLRQLLRANFARSLVSRRVPGLRSFDEVIFLLRAIGSTYMCLGMCVGALASVVRIFITRNRRRSRK